MRLPRDWTARFRRLRANGWLIRAFLALCHWRYRFTLAAHKPRKKAVTEEQLPVPSAAGARPVVALELEGALAQATALVDQGRFAEA